MLSRSSSSPGISTRTSARMSFMFLGMFFQGTLFHSGVLRGSRFRWRMADSAWGERMRGCSAFVSPSGAGRGAYHLYPLVSKYMVCIAVDMCHGSSGKE